MITREEAMRIVAEQYHLPKSLVLDDEVLEDDDWYGISWAPVAPARGGDPRRLVLRTGPPLLTAALALTARGPRSPGPVEPGQGAPGPARLPLRPPACGLAFPARSAPKWKRRPGPGR